MNGHRRAEAIINLAALRHNLQQVRRAAPTCKVMAAIKANAYGHGLIEVAQALSNADALAVATIDEANTLRQQGIVQPIVLLDGVLEAIELQEAAANDIAVVFHQSLHIEWLQSLRLTKPLKVWLKLDSGMHRLGLSRDEFLSANAQLNASNQVQKPLGLLSHLACADEKDSHYTNEQLKQFENATQTLIGERSLANSAGILGWPQTHFDWVRPGIMLYGASPFASEMAAVHHLQPVLTLRSRIIAVRQLKQGDAVGYGGIWTAPKDTIMGVVAMGYGDGYPRHAQNGTPVLIHGKRAPLIGRVSMDLICVDLGTRSDVQIGDPVTLWGDGLPIEEIAEKAGTISYELLTGITQRVNRLIVDPPHHQIHQSKSEADN